MKKSSEILITQEQIKKRAAEIGAQITKDYEGEELVLIGILRGSVPWMVDIMQNIDNDKLIMDYMACSSYGSGTKTTGKVRINKDIQEDVEGKHVLIIEDIIDSGITLKYLKGYFANKGAADFKICTLLDKPAGRKVDIEGDYIGFEVGDQFIVGYGLDYDQKYRQLPYIGYLIED